MFNFKQNKRWNDDKTKVKTAKSGLANVCVYESHCVGFFIQHTDVHMGRLMKRDQWIFFSNSWSFTPGR